jgi:hypothetical protein
MFRRGPPERRVGVATKVKVGDEYGFSYWPEGVEATTENMVAGLRKDAAPGDTLTDMQDSDVAALELGGAVTIIKSSKPKEVS